MLQLTDWPEIYSKSSPDSQVFDGYCFRFARPEDVRTLVDDPALAASFSKAAIPWKNTDTEPAPPAPSTPSATRPRP